MSHDQKVKLARLMARASKLIIDANAVWDTNRQAANELVREAHELVEAIYLVNEFYA